MNSTTTTTTSATNRRRRLPRRRRTKNIIVSSSAKENNDDNYSSSSTIPFQSDDNDNNNMNIITSNISSEDEDLAHCLILLSQHGTTLPRRPDDPAHLPVYECKTCSRVFPSFQALGGHRTSHKKPRPDPARSQSSDEASRASNMVLDQDDHKASTSKYQLIQPIKSSLDMDNNKVLSSNPDDIITISNNNSKGRVHECSICGSEFASGQALGGHMRRHRPPQQPAPATHNDRPIIQKNVLPLDLNLPAVDDDDDDDVCMENKFHVLHPTPPLVDCHY